MIGSEAAPGCRGIMVGQEPAHLEVVLDGEEDAALAEPWREVRRPDARKVDMGGNKYECKVALEKPRPLTVSGAKSKHNFLLDEAKLRELLLKSAFKRGSKIKKAAELLEKLFLRAAARDEHERKILYEESRVAAAKAPCE